MNKGKIKCPTPPMGWTSYCSVNCDPTEALIMEAADKLGIGSREYELITID